MAVVPDALTLGSAVADAALIVGGIGPVTSAGEMVATSVGAGILLGGFVAGVSGTLRRWTRRRRDEAVVRLGYFGGIWMAFAVVGETILR
ncbi:MAG TPA: hypothetical protein VEX36_01615 [Thermoleophilaceae bacterium]|nr:hypothetical protein [Thermoleophilaceae bacterium]